MQMKFTSDGAVRLGEQIRTSRWLHLVALKPLHWSLKCAILPIFATTSLWQAAALKRLASAVLFRLWVPGIPYSVSGVIAF